jgi:hypothetical protein
VLKSKPAGASASNWEEFEDVADRTVCHKCLIPCPVDIDFGGVDGRNLLRKMGQRSPPWQCGSHAVNATSPQTIKVMRARRWWT